MCRTRPVDKRFEPFCSERCKLADLNRWLNGDYRVSGASGVDAATVRLDDEDDAPEPER